MVAAGDINNSNYTVKADEDIVMNATNINNISTAASATIAAATPTKIEAGKMVSLNAQKDSSGNGGNITNLGATIKGGDLVYLTAANNITNKALIDYKINGSSVNPTFTGDAASYLTSLSSTEDLITASSANNIRSTLVSQGIIESGGNIVLVANNDINNQGSKITSAGSTLLEATNGDVNIATSILRDRTVESGGKKKNSWTRTTDTTTNLESEITSGGDLYVSAFKGGVDITGSDLTSSGDLMLTAKDEVNIVSAIDSYYKENTSNKKGSFSKTTSRNSNSTTTNVTSDLVAGGDVSITSGSDTNIFASNLSGRGRGSIIAGKYLDTDAASSTYNTEIFNPDAQVNILNGVDTNYSYSQTTRTTNALSPKNLALATLAVTAAAATGGASLYLLGGIEYGKSKTTSGSYSESVVKSNLTFGESLNIASADNLNVRASKLLAGTDINSGDASGNQGDIALVAGKITTTDFNTSISTANTNSNAEVNILSGTQNSYSYNINETLGFGGSNIKLNHESLTYGQLDRVKSTNLTGTQIASEITSNNGNVTIASQKDLNILASSVTTSLSDANASNTSLGNINLISDSGNVNILSAYNTNGSATETLHSDINANFNLDSHELALRAGGEGEIHSLDTNIGTVIASNVSGSSVNISSGVSSYYGSGIFSPSADSSNGNISINSSNISAIRDSVNLVSANNANLTTSSNYYDQTISDSEFSAYVRLGASYNFKDTWKSIEDLKDVKLENAVKYLAFSSAAGYAGAGAATPYVTTYGPAIASMMEGDSFDESLAKNADYINDANTINNAGKGGSGSAGLTVELAYSQDKSRFRQEDVVMNSIYSASNINLTSNASDINIHSSNLLADEDINLNARKGEINILADASKTNSSAKSLDLSGSIALVGKGGALNIGYASSKSSSETYVNSLLSAGRDFNLNSGKDTNIISSNILASDINMLVAGDLNLESLQNTSNSRAYSFGIGGGFTSSGRGQSGSGNLSYSISKSERDWVDNQASILGTNSVTINVADNTNLIGSVIANSTNGKTSGDGIDGGNLTLNTGSLTYTNLEDSDFARSLGIGIGGGARSGGSSGGDVKGSVSLSLNYSMHDYEQNTNSVIGSGTIKTGTILNLDSNNNLLSVVSGTDYGSELDTSKSGLNRNIQTAQVTTKSLTVDPIAIKETMDFDSRANSSTTEERPTIWNDLKKGSGDQDASKQAGSLMSNIGSGLLANAKIELSRIGGQINPINAFSNITYGIATDLGNMGRELNLDQQTTEKVTDLIKYSPYLIATAPKVGAITVSEWVDKNNNGVDEKTGQPKDYGAPNFLTGLFYPEDAPTVGRGDRGCKDSALCNVTISDNAPHFRALYYGIPGFKSFAEFHDAGMTDKNGNEQGGLYKAASIPIYIPISYYGSLGTYMKNSAYEYNKPASKR